MLKVKNFHAPASQNTRSSYDAAESEVVKEFGEWRGGKTVVSINFYTIESRWEEDRPGSYIKVIYEE
jgi:hypothetical protein